MIDLRDITIGYPAAGKRDGIVATHIRATLPTGKLTCLVGPNGVGKSTLMRTIAGTLPVLAGDICIDVLLVDDDPTSAVPCDLSMFTARDRAQNIAIVTTRHGEMPSMTVREIVEMGRSPYTGFWGTLSAADHAIVDEALSAVGITALASRMADSLSDGEWQKTMIAKALAQQTPLIILDEPTAFLDYPSKLATMRMLASLCHDYGKTVFLSTHDMEVAMRTADTMWLMMPTDDDRRVSLTAGDPMTLGAVLMEVKSEK